MFGWSRFFDRKRCNTAGFTLVFSCIFGCAFTFFVSSSLSAEISWVQSSDFEVRESKKRSQSFDGMVYEGFEKFPVGEIKRKDVLSGSWVVESGKCFVTDKHFKNGKRSLHMTGGRKCSLIWTIPDRIREKDEGLELIFFAERWASRGPFQFRIQATNGQSWKEIFRGDNKIRVGRSFLSNVKVLIPKGWSKAVRFTVGSPEGTGVLLDQMQLKVPKPQKILSSKLSSFTSPVLLRVPFNPVAKVVVATSGSKFPKKVSAISIKMPSKESVSEVQVFAGSTPNFRTANPVSNPFKIGQINSNELSIPLKQNYQLSDGKNFFWVAVKPTASVAVGQSISLEIRKVYSEKKELNFSGGVTSQRVGIALRKAGDDGVHTYRIPGLVRSNKGTLIAVYDIRRRGSRDLPGDIDVGVSRSMDGGKSWKPMQVAMDMGSDPKWNYDGIGDPSILVDRQTGTIWIAALWSHGNRGWNGSGAGTEPEKTGQFVLVKSQDEGRTWSKPINITSQIKKKEWCLLLQGPGKGITMKDGTLVFPAQFQSSQSRRRLPFSTIVYSKDHGKSWQIGTGAFPDTTEAQVIEVSPGTLMLNCRYNRSNHRVVMTTSNMGKSWKEHSTSRSSLIEPRACMGSLIDTKSFPNKKSPWLLFSNPNNTKQRSHLSIKASMDRGTTWPEELGILLDEGRGRGYSCMAMIDEKTVGILYEGSGADLVFQRISLGEFLKKPNKDTKVENKGNARISRNHSTD